MPYQISDPVDIPRLQQMLAALQAEMDDRERATAALARRNAELNGELQRRLAESESFYWIAQEALNNVRKHAAAQHVTVHLQFTASTIVLEVTDDGVGFDPQAVRAEGRGGGGLRSIAERAGRVGGKLTHESRPGRGTRVRVEVTL